MPSPATGLTAAIHFGKVLLRVAELAPHYLATLFCLIVLRIRRRFDQLLKEKGWIKHKRVDIPVYKVQQKNDKRHLPFHRGSSGRWLLFEEEVRTAYSLQRHSGRSRRLRPRSRSPGQRPGRPAHYSGRA